MGAGNVIPTRDELLAELTAELIGPEIPEDAITVHMLMEQSGRHEKVCRGLLDEKVRQGKLSFVKCSGTKYYYPVENG
jgi:hypothetical protein